MMHILTVCFGAIGFFLIINLFFSFLYLLSKSAGEGFYRWASHDDLEISVIVTTPLFGLTQYVASKLYEKFNWFMARMLLLLYGVLVLTLAIVFFILFDYLIEST